MSIFNRIDWWKVLTATVIILLGIAVGILWFKKDKCCDDDRGLTDRQRDEVRVEVDTRAKPIEEGQASDSARIDALEDRMDAVENRLTAVEDNVVVVGNELHGVSNRVTALEADAAKYNTQILVFDTAHDFTATKVADKYFIQIKR